MGQLFEAENGVLTGTEVSTARPGYSGSGYVTGFDASGDRFSLTFNASKGVYNIYIRYASGFGDKFNFVHVNGQNLGSVIFPVTTTFAETKIGKVYLRDGSNSLAIVKDWGYFDVDNIRLEASTASSIYNLDPRVVSSASSPKTDSVYNLLSHLYGKVILSGQYGGATEFSHIKNVSGKTPVVRGFDFIDYSPSRVERGTTSAETEEAIAWSQQRGMVTFCWHWNAPKDLVDQPGKEWWRGFYSEATNFDLAKAMNDTASEEYTLILRDVDAIAVQLRRLSDANVPVLWRPLHEAEGKWFWWGARGAEPCKWLWKLLFNRLVNHHGLNNLIWVWTSTGNAGAIDWYPGNGYVDIIAADIYLPAGEYSSHFTTFDNIASLYGGSKMIALSENGPMPHPDRLFFENAAWSWFATWSGNFITDGIVNSETQIDAVYNHDYVITLDEIDAMDAIIASLAIKKGQDPPVTPVGEDVSPAITFQNPVIDNKLVLKNAGYPAKVLIYNMQGEIEFPETMTGPDHLLEFDFEPKAAGIYLLKVITSGSVNVYRVIKL
ncbi:MAG TPA: glycosyl hydrolase [Chryseosolibacter sp.]|nr:glycosyl hydrolase [Chryseosolibacter sp.]